jgi:HD-like signal output (HDOD) protein
MNEITQQAFADVLARAQAADDKQSQVLGGLLKQRLKVLFKEFSAENPMLGAIQHAEEDYDEALKKVEEAKRELKEASVKGAHLAQEWLTLMAQALACDPVPPGTPAIAAYDHIYEIARRMAAANG